jgi:hypothetical protein
MYAYLVPLPWDPAHALSQAEGNHVLHYLPDVVPLFLTPSVITS